MSLYISKFTDVNLRQTNDIFYKENDSVFHFDKNKSEAIFKYDNSTFLNISYLLAFVDKEIYQENVEVKSREEIFNELVEFADTFVKEGNKLHYLGNHIINMFNGCKGARRFRNYLSCHMHELGAGPKVFVDAYKKMVEA